MEQLGEQNGSLPLKKSEAKSVLTIKQDSPPGSAAPRRRARVGVFVDYENIISLLPSMLTPEELGDALNRYAQKHGDIVCRWLFADRRNIVEFSRLQQLRGRRSDLYCWRSLVAGIEKASFQIGTPPGEPMDGRPGKELTDITLNNQVWEEMEISRPEIFIFVSGDRGYYDVITRLIKRGYSVCLVASKNMHPDKKHLSNKHLVLEEDCRQGRGLFKAGTAKFVIDDLDLLVI